MVAGLFVGIQLFGTLLEPNETAQDADPAE
jgi:hypothetical protein